MTAMNSLIPQKNQATDSVSTFTPKYSPQTTEVQPILEWRRVLTSETEVSSSVPIPTPKPGEENCQAMPFTEGEALQQAQTFLSSVENLIKEGKRSDAIDQVYNVEDLLLERKFDSARWIIKAAAQYVERAAVPLSVFLSLLIVTRPWKSRFQNETLELVTKFFKRARQEKGSADALELVKGHL
jgi:hypothetical protein